MSEAAWRCALPGLALALHYLALSTAWPGSEHCLAWRWLCTTGSLALRTFCSLALCAAWRRTGNLKAIALFVVQCSMSNDLHESNEGGRTL